jgi:hypothetical protein
LEGAKPSDLPVQTADKFALVIYLKVQGPLGLTISDNDSLFAAGG